MIVSKYTNKRGIPLFRGEIHEDETTVTLDPPITAYDNDTVGSARKYEGKIHNRTQRLDFACTTVKVVSIGTDRCEQTV